MDILELGGIAADPLASATGRGFSFKSFDHRLAFVMLRGLEDPRAPRRRRSSHRGYDCYLRGQLDDEQGSTRCILRRKRIPWGVDAEFRDVLPMEMIWPFRDHECAHEMINCVYDLDVRMLEEYRRQYPDHVFGFEKFLPWAAARLERQGKPVRKAVVTPVPIERTPVAEDLLTSIPFGRCLADLHVLRYDDGDAWGRMTLRHDRTILARTLIELCSDVHHLVAIYPGRFLALEVPQGLVLEVVKRMGGKRLMRDQAVTKR